MRRRRRVAGLENLHLAACEASEYPGGTRGLPPCTLTYRRKRRPEGGMGPVEVIVIGRELEHGAAI